MNEENLPAISRTDQLIAEQRNLNEPYLQRELLKSAILVSHVESKAFEDYLNSDNPNHNAIANILKVLSPVKGQLVKQRTELARLSSEVLFRDEVIAFARILVSRIYETTQLNVALGLKNVGGYVTAKQINDAQCTIVEQIEKAVASAFDELDELQRRRK